MHCYATTARALVSVFDSAYLMIGTSILVTSYPLCLCVSVVNWSRDMLISGTTGRVRALTRSGNRSILMI